MERIIGQSHAVATLRAALRSGRVHHAWIFAGPRGVGKFTTAYELARILLDPETRPGPDGEPVSDPAGRTSRLMAAGSHPDFHVITKELALYASNPLLRQRKLRNIPLDILREHVIGGRTSDDKVHDGPAYRTPALGHGKVFVIDEAELVDAYGQNALLKTLEEPPRETYLFLVTARPEMLLPTIRSRCQLVRFTPLDEAAMRRWLEGAELEVDDAERAWLERFAAGSPGQALLAARYDFRAWADELAPMLDRLEGGAFPDEMAARMSELVEAYAVAWVKDHQQASKDAANKDGVGHLLALLAGSMRERLAASLAAGGNGAAQLRAIDLVREAERQIEGNVNQKMVLENLVIQWTHANRRAAAVPS